MPCLSGSRLRRGWWPALLVWLTLSLAACNSTPPIPALPPTTSPTPAATPVATGMASRPTVQVFFPDVGRGEIPPTPRPGQPSATVAPAVTSVAQARPGQPSATVAPATTAVVQARPSPTATPTPGPTRTPGPMRTPRPSPTPKFPPPIAEPGPSKLGLHVIRNNSPDIMEFIRVTKPRVIKGVDDLHWFAEVKQASPQTVTVGRVTAEHQRIEGDPAAAARAFVAQQLPQYEFNRAGVDYWEGWNEPAPKTPDEMRWYAAFEAERVRALAAVGLKAAVGTYPTGVPEWDLFELFLPAIQAARQHGGVFALHEYSAPTMQYGVGLGLPGRPAYPNRGILNLRYRYWYEDFLKPRGLAIPLVITEAGIDGGIRNRPGPQDAFGWRQFTTYWSQQAMGGDGTQTYLDQLQWYDHEVRQDPYVLGFTVFTAGTPDEQWASFDVTDILPVLARYLVTAK